MSTTTTTTTAAATSTATATATSRLMSELVSYPILLQHEESLTKSTSTENNSNDMYDVSCWMLYLSQVDEILHHYNEAILAAGHKAKTEGKAKRNRGMYSVDTTITIGERVITLKKSSSSEDGDGGVVELKTLKRKLQQARNLISERSLSLLPGSYKLWMDYLTVRSDSYINDGDNNHGNNNADASTSTIISYAIRSSPHHTTYKNTISAYERSLVRMNKYPRVWLQYINFVIHHDPTCSVTNVRRLFNRALLALPATQHDLIWSDYLCFILLGCGDGDNNGNGDGENKNNITTKGLMIDKGKGLGPLVTAVKNGSLSQSTNGYAWSTPNSEFIPPETILRVLRRYAHYYNPAARELLSTVALKFKRYGEAAQLLQELLNDVGFLSVEGTSRHELWMRFTNVCTEYPEESRKAGIEFEGIIRAVLKPEKESKHGWKIFELDANNSEDGDGGGEDGADAAGTEAQERQKKVKEQQAQLQASLGEMEGTLWTKLAHYHIRGGEFEVARSIYEEAMESVTRVRDFTLIFDAYVKFEEGVIEAMMELMKDDDDGDEDEIDAVATKKNAPEVGKDEDDEDMDILLGSGNGNNGRGSEGGEEEENFSADIELAIARAENLMSRRTLLLNYVSLQQNPHNVGEWLRRSELYLEGIRGGDW